MDNPTMPDLPARAASPVAGLFVLGLLGVLWLGLWVGAFICLRPGGEKTVTSELVGQTCLNTAANVTILLPLVVLPILAYGGRHFLALRILAVLYWLGLAGVVALVMLGTSVVAGIVPEQLTLMLTDPEAFKKQHEPPPPPAEGELPPPPKRIPPLFVRDIGPKMRTALGGVTVTGVLALAFFLPAIRRLAARVTPLDPDDFVHATALSTVVLLTGMCLTPLIAFNDPPILSLLRSEELAKKVGEGMAENRTAVQLATALQLFWVVPVGMLTVGYLWQRSASEALVRLGFVVPKWWHVLLAVVATAALVGLAPFLDHGIGTLWQKLGGRPTDEAGVKHLLSFALTPLGAICVGLMAGISEEMLFRGALQPKLGLLLSNLCFTAGHALQYHGDGLLAVFCLGLVMGLIRKYTNTTTSALVHGSYDATLLLLMAAGTQGY